METLTQLSLAHALKSPDDFLQALQCAENISATHRDAQKLPTHLREASVLSEQFPQMLLPMEDEDRFAGRIRYPLVGLSPEAMGLGYYCCFEALAQGAQAYPQWAERCAALEKYWLGKTTEERVRQAYPAPMSSLLPSDAWMQDSGVAFPLYRMAGCNLDYAKLLKLGLDELERQSSGSIFAHVVPELRKSIDFYRKSSSEPHITQQFEAILHHPPKHWREAVQLFWLYALHSGTWNYGRLDDTLGPILCRDLDSGLLTEEEATEDLCSLWRLMNAYANQWNNRVIIGGLGRENEKEADRFGLLAIEATRRVHLNQPQLTLRFHENQNPELWEKSILAIAEGCTFPMLYDDAINIPAVTKAFKVSRSLAEQYTPYGCGEYVLSKYSVGTPSGVINLLKALEVALHNGVDPITQRQVVQQVPSKNIDSFEALWQAYAYVIETHVETLASQQKIEYDVMASEAPLSFISLLSEGCQESGCSVFGGGGVHLGGTLETYGNTNVANSLLAIEELVFNKKILSLEEMIRALDANFVGHEELLKQCQEIPKYGNDNQQADAMARRVHDHVCNFTRNQAKKVGLDSYMVVVINNWANTVLGYQTGASAEGRLAGKHMANGNNPTPGSDRSGVTAFLNSLSKLDPTIHAGAVQNMKFSKEWFGSLRPKFEALLKTYFAKGGTQAMITVLNRQDLESAMKEPEKWTSLLVRVGGFSIRFIDLPKKAQQEILERTLH